MLTIPWYLQSFLKHLQEQGLYHHPPPGLPVPLVKTLSMEKQSLCVAQCESMYLYPRIPALAGIAHANATLKVRVFCFTGTSATKSFVRTL